MEWISVKDRMPETDDAVDIWCKWKEGNPSRVTDARWLKDGLGEYWIARMGHISTNVVTHWMPLPFPPKNEARG
jgi:hypothetical protein